MHLPIHVSLPTKRLTIHSSIHLNIHSSIHLPTHPCFFPQHILFILIHSFFPCSIILSCYRWAGEASPLSLLVKQRDSQAARRVNAVTNDQTAPPVNVSHSIDFCGDIQLHSQLQQTSNHESDREGTHSSNGIWLLPFQGGGFLLGRSPGLTSHHDINDSGIDLCAH